MLIRASLPAALAASLLLTAACSRQDRPQEGEILTPASWNGGRALDGVGPGVVRLGPGVFRVRESLRLPAGLTLEGAGPGATRLMAASEMRGVVMNLNPEDGDARIRVRSLAIDCASVAETGVRLERASDLVLDDLNVRGCRNEGIRVSGRGRVTRIAALRDIVVEENAGDGLIVLWGMRGVTYSGVTASRNQGRGIIIDHSEATATGVRADGNAGRGVHIRNVFGVTIDGLTATRNGAHGVFVEGMVASSGSNWIAMGNGGREPGRFDEVHFSAHDELSYGVTRQSQITGLVVGAYSAGTGAPHARKGVHIDPEVGGLVLEGVSELDFLEPAPAAERSAG